MVVTIDETIPAPSILSPEHGGGVGLAYKGHCSVHNDPRRVDVTQDRVVSCTYDRCQALLLDFGNIPTKTQCHRPSLGCQLSGHTVSNTSVLPTCAVFDDFLCQRDIWYCLPIAWSLEGSRVTNIRDVET